MDCFQMAVESSLQLVIEHWVSDLPRGLQLVAAAHQLTPNTPQTLDLNDASQHVAGLPAAEAVQVCSELLQGTGLGSSSGFPHPDRSKADGCCPNRYQQDFSLMCTDLTIQK